MTTVPLPRASGALWLAGAAAAIGALIALGRILLLFLIISIGPHTVGRPWLIVLGGFGDYDLPLLVLLFAAPSTVVFARRALVRGGKRSALFLICCSALIVLLCHSYRLSALVAALFVAVSAARGWEVGRWITLILAASLCLAPVDITLRVFAYGPRFVPAYYGGFNYTPSPAEGRVWVGGCEDLYAPPRQFWTW